MTDFSIKLKTAMEQKGITATELCKLTGIGESIMSCYLSGEFEPKIGRAVRLAKALGVPAAQLLGIEPPTMHKEEVTMTRRELMKIAKYGIEKKIEYKCSDVVRTWNQSHLVLMTVLL